jgi:hypothetical protein
VWLLLGGHLEQTEGGQREDYAPRHRERKDRHARKKHENENK